ncbi:hypothetical protein DAI22_08g102200 [Oryza sativa Japonica Group]|nr:hypothetical protein DAI22_08g102200 [Oryza sativa Japonica Group]
MGWPGLGLMGGGRVMLGFTKWVGRAGMGGEGCGGLHLMGRQGWEKGKWAAVRTALTIIFFF